MSEHEANRLSYNNESKNYTIMSNSNNSNWKLAFGLLAGAAAVISLNSDKGRRVRQEFQEQAVDYKNQTTDYLQRQAENVGQYYEQGKQALASTVENVKQSISSTTEMVADAAHDQVATTESKVQKGISRAKRKVQNSVS